MGLVVIQVADAKAAAKKLGKAKDGDSQVDVAIRTCATKNAGGPITVPQQLADRVKDLLPSEEAEASDASGSATGTPRGPQEPKTRTKRKPKAE